MRVTALGQYQPLSVHPGDSLLSSAYQPLGGEFSTSGDLSVCFSRKRSLSVAVVRGCCGQKQPLNHFSQSSNSLS